MYRTVRTTGALQRLLRTSIITLSTLRQVTQLQRLLNYINPLYTPPGHTVTASSQLY